MSRTKKTSLPQSGADCPPRSQVDDKRYEISESEFSELAQIIKVQSGITLTKRKRNLLTSRLRKRLVSNELPDYKSYIAFLKAPEGHDEAVELINAISTNLTSFFREPHHFRDMVDCLQEAAPNDPTSQSLRIWSSACSTGEEPYTIGMALVRSNILRSYRDTRILATDIDTTVLGTAQTGIYSAKQMESCPLATQRNCFTRLSGDNYKIDPEVKKLITFNQLNLQKQWPIKTQFDFIYCRNVLIYFDDTAKLRLVSRLVDQLKIGGTLYLGHSESLLGNSPHLQGIGNCIFRKIE